MNTILKFRNIYKRYQHKISSSVAYIVIKNDNKYCTKFIIIIMKLNNNYLFCIVQYYDTIIISHFVLFSCYLFHNLVSSLYSVLLSYLILFYYDNFVETGV